MGARREHEAAAPTLSTASELPLVSVVVPTMFPAPDLARCLASIAAQTGPRFEIIVVDDGSGAELPAIEAAAIGAAGVRLVRRDTNGGAAAARNTGLAAAQGSFVAFVDSDDEVRSGWMDRLCRPLADDPGVVLSTCGYLIDHGDGGAVANLPTDLGPAFNHLATNYLTGTVMWRTEWLRAIGGYDDRLRVGENFELALRVAARHGDSPLRIASIDDPLYVWHKRADYAKYAPEHRLRSAEITLATHRIMLARDPGLLASQHAAAARSGVALHAPGTRVHAWKAWQANRSDRRALARFLLVSNPVGRMIFRRLKDTPGRTA